MLGAAFVCVLATLVLIAGSGLSAATIVTLALIGVALGAAFAIWRRRSLPRRLGPLPRPTLGNLVALVAALGSVAILAAMLHLAWTAPMGGGDSFQFWVPKAKVIYYYGTIDTTKFTSLDSPRYPMPCRRCRQWTFASWAAPTGPGPRHPVLVLLLRLLAHGRVVAPAGRAGVACLGIRRAQRNDP